MTLTTTIIAYRPVPIEPLFRYCQGLLGDPDEQTVEWASAGEPYSWDPHGTPRENHVIQNEPGQGLDALLRVRYGADGPLVYEEEQDVPGTPVLEVSFDTSYSWDSPRPGGHIDLVGGPGVHAHAGDLHAYYVTRVVEYLTEKRSPWAWLLENTGEWYDTIDDIEMLGEPWKLVRS